jgi:hypothetical protein
VGVACRLAESDSVKEKLRNTDTPRL